MLKQLYVFLGTKFERCEKGLDRIVHTTCSSNYTAMYDFDEIVRQFCKEKQTARLNSVDALYYTKKDKLLLIEMKKYDPNLPKKNHFQVPKTVSEFIEEKFSHNELPRKILDSLFMLISICRHYNYQIGIYESLLIRQNKNIYPILLVNLDDRKYVSYCLQFPAERNIGIAKLLCENKAKIFNCTRLADFLASETN